MALNNNLFDYLRRVISENVVYTVSDSQDVMHVISEPHTFLVRLAIQYVLRRAGVEESYGLSNNVRPSTHNPGCTVIYLGQVPDEIRDLIVQTSNAGPSPQMTLHQNISVPELRLQAVLVPADRIVMHQPPPQQILMIPSQASVNQAAGPSGESAATPDRQTAHIVRATIAAANAAQRVAEAVARQERLQ